MAKLEKHPVLNFIFRKNDLGPGAPNFEKIATSRGFPVIIVIFLFVCYSLRLNSLFKDKEKLYYTFRNSSVFKKT